MKGAAGRLSQDLGSRSRVFAIITLIVVLIGLLTLPAFVDTIDHDAPRLRNGVVTFGSGEGVRAPVELIGEWRIFWQSGPKTGGEVDHGLVDFPSGWAGIKLKSGATMPGQASLSAIATINGLPPGDYRLFQLPIYGASRIWVNGKLKSSHGQIGNNAATSHYRALAHDVWFESDGGPVTLRLDISTFHGISNGLDRAPLLGASAPMNRWMALAWCKELIIDATALVIGLFALVVFMNRREDRAALYQALAMLAVFVNLFIQGFESLLLIVFPGVNHYFMYGLLAFSSWFALMIVPLLMGSYFPLECPPRLRNAVAGMVGLGLAGKMLTYFIAGPLISSYYSQAFPYIFIIVFLFTLWVSIRAVHARRSGSILIFLGFVGICLTFTYQLAASYGLFNFKSLMGFDVANYGLLIYLFTHVMVLAQRWSGAITNAETLNADLSQLLDVNSAATSEARLETLLSKIVGVNTAILGAERSSLFLHDPKAGQLWSMVAEGIDARALRFGERDGLAGQSFQSGQPINTPDAYADPQFNARFDHETGFKTRDILTVPVNARDGRKIGVMQALNSKTGQGFSKADEARMSAFAAQAAIAIDNATLFSEVEASRNYNESILQSMSSGVVTLEEGSRQARLNEAASRIFGVTKEQAEDADAQEFLERTNPALVPEIDHVAESGEPKSLLDHELVTVRGETVSANISIVPLRREQGANGILLMLDDISANKRLEGAMRRFMTQEVMDQVLGQDGDLLFGSACQASVLFADIRGFTTMAEKLTPRQTVDMLNSIFTELFEAVADAGGVLDKYIGDAVMAVFGAPITSGQDAANAVAAAVRMQEMMRQINTSQNRKGKAMLNLGIGIASGEVVAGTIGSPKRMDYTVIGDSVNLSSRLQDITKAYKADIIVCEQTAAAIGTQFGMRPLDLIRVRGRNRAARIFEVAGAGSDRALLFEAYTGGLEAVDARDWPKALAGFEMALQIAPDDYPSKLMQRRVQGALASPPASDWDGVWQD